jgi:hypothetical protein
MLCGHGGCSWLYWFVAGFEPSIGWFVARPIGNWNWTCYYLIWTPSLCVNFVCWRCEGCRVALCGLPMPPWHMDLGLRLQYWVLRVCWSVEWWFGALWIALKWQGAVINLHWSVCACVHVTFGALCISFEWVYVWQLYCGNVCAHYLLTPVTLAVYLWASVIWRLGIVLH